MKNEKEAKMLIENQMFDAERALYGSDGVEIKNCRFDGPADGESALKESRNILVSDSYFNLRYPFWHDNNVVIENSEMTPACRAAIWYTENIKIKNTAMHGIKALRECRDINIENCDIVSPEFGWFSHDIRMTSTHAESEYFMLRTSGLRFNDVTLKGKYSFQYLDGGEFDNCDFNTKDAFWHSRGVTIRNSRIVGEYLAWYSEGLTLIDCVISGTQPLCYCRGLKLINCRMENADLAFEKSDVDATLTAPIISIKNPASGTIRVPECQNIITDDPNARGVIKITN